MSTQPFKWHKSSARLISSFLSQFTATNNEEDDDFSDEEYEPEFLASTVDYSEFGPIDPLPQMFRVVILWPLNHARALTSAPIPDAANSIISRAPHVPAT